MKKTNQNLIIVAILFIIVTPLGIRHHSNKHEIDTVDVVDTVGTVDVADKELDDTIVLDDTPLDTVEPEDIPQEDTLYDVNQFMYWWVSDIITSIPIYGMSQLDTNVNIVSQFDDDGILVMLETDMFTQFVLRDGSFEKVTVFSEVPEGFFEQRLSPEQQSHAMLTLYSSPNKIWTDEEIEIQFLNVANTFGITENELKNRGIKISRTKVNTSKPLQYSNMPPIPDIPESGPDAFIKATSEAFEVIFRTEKINNEYILSLVKLTNI